jgi:hypothetical protein
MLSYFAAYRLNASNSTDKSRRSYTINNDYLKIRLCAGVIILRLK